ncbi:MAG TPA: MOSC N-terminal beta barrel domain-containing protein [Candidatus Binataceae bacterium]
MGTITELWRFPVKSMAGEPMEKCYLGPRGIPGDRGWAVRDETAGEIRGAKKLPTLMQCHAAYLSEPAGTEVPPAEITFPDRSRARTGDKEAQAKLSAFLGRPVTLWPLQPPDALEHYRHGKPDNPDMINELRQIFGRLEDEPLPDFSTFPPGLLQELMTYTSPLGTYFDAYPLHLVTTATLAALSERNPTAQFDVRRFRPNVLIETRSEIRGLAEAEWSGRTLSIGDVQLKLEMPVVRCVMTTLAQDDLPKDPSVLRTIVRDAAQNLGVYATITKPGHIRCGDPVELH